MRELSNTDLPPLSGRLLPEFDKRRSIKDMFARTTSHSEEKRSRASHEEIHATQEQDISKAHDACATEAEPNSRAPAKTPPSHSPLNAAEKRRVTISPAVKPPKRPKLKATASKQQSSSKGQQSLKGFFTSTADRPGSPEPPEPSQAAGDGLPGESAVQCRAQLTAYRETAQPDVSHTTETREAAPCPSQDTACAELAAAADADQPVDLDTAREEWTRLFSRKPPPRCESHTEPCISLTTKKPGVNCGRRFWICPRWAFACSRGAHTKLHTWICLASATGTNGCHPDRSAHPATKSEDRNGGVARSSGRVTGTRTRHRYVAWMRSPLCTSRGAKPRVT